jgi:hypothetical protein
VILEVQHNTTFVLNHIIWSHKHEFC